MYFHFEMTDHHVSNVPLFCHSAKEPTAIKVTLPDGKVVDGQSWRTTPYEVASGIR